MCFWIFILYNLYLKIRDETIEQIIVKSDHKKINLYFPFNVSFNAGFLLKMRSIQKVYSILCFFLLLKCFMFVYAAICNVVMFLIML